MRDGASTRFQPNRRASIDHKPGPNMASAPAIVPRNKGAHASAGNITICPISIAATSVPAIGVHRPGTIRMPDPARSTHVNVTPTGRSPLRTVIALISRAEPTTSRIRSRPIPGQPPANVEYKRRKKAPFPFLPLRISYICETNDAPERAGRFTLSRLDDKVVGGT